MKQALELNAPTQQTNLTVRMVRLPDSAAIASIYNYYIENTIATFEEIRVSTTEVSNRIKNVLSDSLPWLVAEKDGNVCGYAYAAKWRARSAYRYSVESSVYVDPSWIKMGIGDCLYANLLNTLKAKNIHAIMAGIALPNPASIALHEYFGFVKTAHFKEVGIKFNRWIDVGYWQLNP